MASVADVLPAGASSTRLVCLYPPQVACPMMRRDQEQLASYVQTPSAGLQGNDVHTMPRA
jgi:hypothetical protein